MRDFSMWLEDSFAEGLGTAKLLPCSTQVVWACIQKTKACSTLAFPELRACLLTVQDAVVKQEGNEDGQPGFQFRMAAPADDLKPAASDSSSAGWQRQCSGSGNPFEHQPPQHRTEQSSETDLTDAFCEPFLGSPLTPLPLLSLN